MPQNSSGVPSTRNGHGVTRRLKREKKDWGADETLVI